MGSSHSSYIDAQYANMSAVGRDQVNITFNGRDSLQKLEPVKMDVSRRSGCLANTRIDILQFIIDWVNDPASEHNMLWLHGLAGSGKSTLSTTIANHFSESGELGAFLFFNRDVTERNDPTIVIRTLAHQLGASEPKIGAAISAVVERNSNILMSSLSRQFQKLILEPVSTIDGHGPTIVIILDALDECGTAGQRETLLEVLSNDFANLPLHIRTIIASRAEIDICNAFESRQHILAHELDITSQFNSDDIMLYFRHIFALIRNKNKHLQLVTDWPGEEALRRLVQQASGLFVWASTASAFINAHDPRKRLDIILRGEVTSGAEAALDALYNTALQSVGRWDDPDFVADFRAILGIILVARQPLSSTAIDALLHLPVDRPSMHTISLLGCVLQQSPKVRVLHPSFADFLMATERCDRDIWFFDRRTYHQHLAFRCLNRMDTFLQRNMCNLTLAVDLVNETLPEDISYSCLFWIDHVCAIEEQIQQIMDDLRHFLIHHLLHWFEAMSILRKSSATILCLDRLIDCISNYPPNDASLSQLIHDASQFARVFSPTIEDHPLLVYMSALPLTPTNTTLYQTFHSADQYPSILGHFQHSWSLLLHVLTGHTDAVQSVAVSPDGTRLVSGSEDMTIRVWDMSTAAEVSQLRGHEDWVSSVAFSPDGGRIISGSFDATIRVWNITTEKEALPSWRGHNDCVTSIALSPDGTRIVSGSRDKTLLVWEAATGVAITKLIGHHDWVLCVAFSRDGTKVISGSEDGIIKVWDLTTSSVVSEICGHVPIIALDCSPDGTQFVSGSAGRNIHIWDLATTDPVLTIQVPGKEGTVTSLKYSADGTRIVSGLCDHAIRIWDVTSGTEVRPDLRGHFNAAMSVAFTPDGKKVISGSLDHNIHIWDVPACAGSLPAEHGYEYSVCSIAFSPDGTKMASGSADGTVLIWDAISCVEILVIQKHEGEVWAAEFSPDSCRIVSGSVDETVRVCNASTGEEIISALQENAGGVRCAAFSPNGNMIVSGSNNGNIIVLDVITGANISELRGHEGHISSVAFSPDGSKVVSGSWDRTVRVWNVTTGAQIFPAIRGPQSPAVVFSPDSTRILSVTITESMSWDAASGSPLQLVAESDHLSLGSIYFNRDGWIVDSATGRTLSKLRTMLFYPHYATHERSLAVGQENGGFLVMHFPPALLMSQDTRTVNGKTRKRHGFASI